MENLFTLPEFQMSLLTTIITPIVYRNWFFKSEDCRYDAGGICIDEGK
ncbi:MAG: hypothetical protein Q7J03_05875 [Methanoregula sp.]|nr:hypothetical protein [Methanoregula sp.]